MYIDSKVFSKEIQNENVREIIEKAATLHPDMPLDDAVVKIYSDDAIALANEYSHESYEAYAAKEDIVEAYNDGFSAAASLAGFMINTLLKSIVADNMREKMAAEIVNKIMEANPFNKK